MKICIYEHIFWFLYSFMTINIVGLPTLIFSWNQTPNAKSGCLMNPMRIACLLAPPTSGCTARTLNISTMSRTLKLFFLAWGEFSEYKTSIDQKVICHGLCLQYEVSCPQLYRRIFYNVAIWGTENRKWPLGKIGNKAAGNQDYIIHSKARHLKTLSWTSFKTKLIINQSRQIVDRLIISEDNH